MLPGIQHSQGSRSGIPPNGSGSPAAGGEQLAGGGRQQAASGTHPGFHGEGSGAVAALLSAFEEALPHRLLGSALSLMRLLHAVGTFPEVRPSSAAWHNGTCRHASACFQRVHVCMSDAFVPPPPLGASPCIVNCNPREQPTSSTMQAQPVAIAPIAWHGSAMAVLDGATLLHTASCPAPWCQGAPTKYTPVCSGSLLSPST